VDICGPLAYECPCDSRWAFLRAWQVETYKEHWSLSNKHIHMHTHTHTHTHFLIWYSSNFSTPDSCFASFLLISGVKSYSLVYINFIPFLDVFMIVWVYSLLWMGVWLHGRRKCLVSGTQAHMCPFPWKPSKHTLPLCGME
jgi:hypothetical protein